MAVFLSLAIALGFQYQEMLNAEKSCRINEICSGKWGVDTPTLFVFDVQRDYAKTPFNDSRPIYRDAPMLTDASLSHSIVCADIGCFTATNRNKRWHRQTSLTKVLAYQRQASPALQDRPSCRFQCYLGHEVAWLAQDGLKPASINRAVV